VRRTILAEALVELGIPDPKGTLVTALARYAREAILRGIAIFKAKLLTGTIPDGADHGPYLGGIIRNTNDKLELNIYGDFLLAVRLRERDLALDTLVREFDRLSAQASALELPQRLIEHALEAVPHIDFRYWLRQARVTLEKLGVKFAAAIARSMVSLVAKTFKATRERREDLIAMLTGTVVAAA
jgi:hypothetical protein